MIDLGAATTTLCELVEGVDDDQLSAPTPCRETSVAGLLSHIDGFTVAFTAAAMKATPPGGSRPPTIDPSRLGSDWRTRIPQQLDMLAVAWRDEAAWTGMTKAGGLDLPAELVGLIALDEVIVHGWDLAVASGQEFPCEPELAEAAYRFVEPTVARGPEGTPGLFGPPVRLPESAPILDRLLGLTGRDPAWRR